MSYNRTTQEELEIFEAELICAYNANAAITRYEEINLIGNQQYGKPKFSDDETQENSCLRKHTN